MNKIGSTIADHAVADSKVEQLVPPNINITNHSDVENESLSDERVIDSRDTGDRVTLWGVNVLTLDLLQMER